jgi:AP endonuclease-2
VDKEGREVVLIGDINVCAAVIDHCDGHLMVAKGIAEGRSGEAGFGGMMHEGG